MKINLPIIGQIRTGKDSLVTEVIKEVEAKNKFFDVLGGLLEFGPTTLSNYKSVSDKILKANTGWVYRNNDAIAQEVSKIEFELYTIGLSGGEIVFNEVTSHPLLDLLDKPNDETTKTAFIYLLQSHKKLIGDAFILKLRTNGIVTNLRLLPADKVFLNLQAPTEQDPTVIKSYTYKDTIDGNQIQIDYDPADIVPIKKPNPNNQFRGLGAVEAMADTIDLDNLASEVMKSYFKNGAINNFALTTDAKITDEQLKRLKAELKSAISGPQNAFSAPILGGGLKPVDISYSTKEQQLIDQWQWYRDKIMYGFGNTKASLGMIDDVNRASHEGSIIEWQRNTVKPDMQAIVEALNNFLVPEFGENLVLGFCDPVPEDRADDVAEVQALYPAGVITLDEARELVDLDPMEDGSGTEVYQKPVPIVTTPGETNDSNPQNEPPKKMKTPKALENISLKAALRRSDIYIKLEENRKLKESFKPYAKSVIKKPVVEIPQQISKSFTNEVIDEYVKKRIHTIEIVEDKFQNKLEQFINYVKNGFLKNLDAEISKKNFTKFLQKDFFSDNEDEFMSKAELDFSPLLDSIASIAGNDAFELIGKDEPYLLTNYREKIVKNINKFTKSMLETDRDHLINVITQGLEEGKTNVEIRNIIETDFSDYSVNQAKRITTTEVARASQQAAIDAYEQSGVVEGLQWIIFGADDECADYDGEVRALDDSGFYAADNEFQDGDPPLHPNCKCQLIPIVIDTQPTYNPDKTYLLDKIRSLESQIDKRTKAFKELKVKQTDDAAYIKSLEKYLGVSDEPPRQA